LRLQQQAIGKGNRAMYAVIRTGGKQYRVNKDDVIAVERLDGEAGDKVKFDDILLVGEAGKEPKIGTPTVSGASVSAEVIGQDRADKITVVKFKRRKNYHRTKGHQQHQTFVRITDISAKAAAKKAAPKKAEASEE
jgi:large subunit ribosomal protein L21